MKQQQLDAYKKTYQGTAPNVPLELIAEIEQLQEQLHHAQELINLISEFVEAGALYEPVEDDCRWCGAEGYEDGYHHDPGCWADKIETELQLYRARIRQKR